MIRFARLLLAATPLACLVPALSAHAQTTTETPLMRQVSRLDLGISGMGSIGSDVSGKVLPPNAPNYGTGSTVLSESPSNTFGALVNLRYIARPYVGLEFNYTYARYTETFTNVTLNQPQPPDQIQTGANEYSFGYIVTPPHPIFGLQPFVSAGAGSTRFKPTAGGGNGAPTQWRATYYYSLGAQKEFGDGHFGVRGAFRENFFLAPDFLLNYLTILQHTHTLQPNIGFYLRF